MVQHGYKRCTVTFSQFSVFQALVTFFILVILYSVCLQMFIKLYKHKSCPTSNVKTVEYDHSKIYTICMT